MFFVLIFPVRNTAIKKARITLIPLVRTAYINVFLIPIFKERSEKNIIKLSSPVNRQFLKSHTVILKKKEAIVGMIKMRRKTIMAGTRNQVEYIFFLFIGKFLILSSTV